MNLQHKDVDVCPIYLCQLGMYDINLEISYEKWITVHLKINACFPQYIYIYIYIFYSFADFSMPSILIACDFVYNYVSLPFSEGEKY